MIVVLKFSKQNRLKIPAYFETFLKTDNFLKFWERSWSEEMLAFADLLAMAQTLRRISWTKVWKNIYKKSHLNQ